MDILKKISILPYYSTYFQYTQQLYTDVVRHAGQTFGDNIIMSKFNFWKRYLYVISFLLIVMGIFVTFFKDTSFYELFSQFIDPIFWPDNIIAENTKHFKSFIYSFSGTYVLLWGVNMLFISIYAFKPENKWAWYNILVTTLVWICIMFPFSLYYGVVVNAYGDIVFFVMIILPLIMTRKYFFRHNIKELK